MNEIILKITDESDTEKIATTVSKTKNESIVIMQTIKGFESHESNSTMAIVLLKDEAIQLANLILESYK